MKTTHWIGKSKLFSYKGIILDIHCCKYCNALFLAMETSLDKEINCPNCGKKIKLSMKPTI